MLIFLLEETVFLDELSGRLTGTEENIYHFVNPRLCGGHIKGRPSHNRILERNVSNPLIPAVLTRCEEC